MTQPRLVILTGPPGAGKTTVSRTLASRYAKSAVVASDWFWTTVVNGALDPWTPESNAQNEAMIRSACATASRLCASGYTTVLEGIIGPWFLGVAQEEIASCRDRISYVVLRPSIELCLSRAVDRLLEPEHKDALSEEGPIRHMYEQFCDLGRYEKYVITDAERTPEQMAQFIASQIEGTTNLALEL